MKNRFIFGIFVLAVLAMPFFSFAQEEEIDVEESAEVFLDEYTDDFQEAFFEALKQKGIQNYDRAANLLLKCRQLNPDNIAVVHELAKVNLLDKNYVAAQEYAIEALTSKPENYWFLNTLVEVLNQHGGTVESIKDNIPYGNVQLQENLATLYFKRSQYNAALQIIRGLKKSDFTEELTLKINDSLQRVQKSVPSTNVIEPTAIAEDPLEQLKNEIMQSLSDGAYKAVLLKTGQAIEAYPLQPFFYYAQGLALNKDGEYQRAIEVLQSGMDYLFDDDKMANQFYTEIAAAYRAVGDLSKANEYLSKVKPGL